MIERTRRVILLIDYDNLQICASRDTPGRELQLEPVVQLAQRYGTVMVARAYAEWNLSTERLAVYKAGIEPAFAPVLRTESDRSGKSLADTVMVAEGMDMLWTLAPDVLVMATSDKDLIPLARVAKQRGARVVILGSDFTAIPLREMADEHVTYKQLITDGPARAIENAAARVATVGVGTGESAFRRGGREQREPREPREVRTPREPREPREERTLPALPLAAPVAATAAAPVQSIAVGSAVTDAGLDADALLAGRRRRRRGSRRRTDRLPGSLEDGSNEELAEDVFDGSTTEVDDVSSPTVEEALAQADPLDAVESSPYESAAEPMVSESYPSESEGPISPAEGISLNGTVDTDEVTTEDAEAPTPRPRTRRVASAARGRSRPAR